MSGRRQLQREPPGGVVPSARAHIYHGRVSSCPCVRSAIMPGPKLVKPARARCRLEIWLGLVRGKCVSFGAALPACFQGGSAPWHDDSCQLQRQAFPLAIPLAPEWQLFPRINSLRRGNSALNHRCSSLPAKASG